MSGERCDFLGDCSLTEYIPNAIFEHVRVRALQKHFSKESWDEHMSQVQLVRAKPVERAEKRMPASVKRCKSCWRDDFHEDVKMPMFVFGFLLVVTFGLFLLFRPSRCVCCGTMRIG